MKEYLLSELKIGNYFSQATYLDENYILLSPEIPLSEQLMNRLLRWDYVRVYSDGSPSDSQIKGTLEIEPEVVNLNVQLKEKAKLHSAAKNFRKILEFTDGIFEQFISKGKLSQNTITDKTKDFVEEVRNLRQYMLRYNEFDSSVKAITLHSVKTTVIGIILGQELRLPTHKLIELGMACLLHEIGMLKLPGQLYMSDKLLGEQERKTISAHPILAFKILRALNFPMNVCLAVLESHENVDGSGYPQHLRAARISEYGKILPIISSYVAMTSERPFRKAMNGHLAIIELLKNRGTRYDPSLVNTLVKLLSIYPIGTFVKVKNGATGMVMETFRDKPKAPLVKLIRGPKGEAYKESPIISTDNEDYQIIAILPQTSLEG